MSEVAKLRIKVQKNSQDIEPETINRMTRIEAHTSVMGILYIKNTNLKICTVPVTMAQALIVRLPIYSRGVHHALKEIDVLDEMIAYRIATKNFEIMVAAGMEYTACVVHRVRKSKQKKDGNQPAFGKRGDQANTQQCLNDDLISRIKEGGRPLPSSETEYRNMKVISNLLKDRRDEWLVNTTVVINHHNPMIDRIMEDDSVKGVIMTNKEGTPILTNISSTRATNYGISLHPIGYLAHIYIKELDTFDEVLVTRIITKNVEIMIAPHPEFNIVVIQHARHKLKNSVTNNVA